MAQFGTIADWLNYDKIRMASAKRNLVGEGIGEAFTGLAQIVEDKADLLTGKKPENPFDKFKDFDKPVLNVNYPDMNMGVITGDKPEITLQAQKEAPANDPKVIKDDPPPVNPPAAELMQAGPIDLSINTNVPTDRTFDTYNYSTQNYEGVTDISESTKNPSA